MIRGILFDLDGTLLDTAPDLVASLNHVRELEGLQPVPVEDYRHLASKGAQGLISGGMPACDKGRLRERKEAFLEHYAVNSVHETRPFDGVPQLLSSLQSRAVPWGIVTNKLEYLTLPILEATGLLAGAGCVICGDTLSHSKPHPAPVRLGCEILGVATVAMLMVGDDIRDIEAGVAAGVHTALAAYGYVDQALDPSSLQDTFIVNEPADVLQLLSG